MIDTIIFFLEERFSNFVVISDKPIYTSTVRCIKKGGEAIEQGRGLDTPQ
jgi:hypothetical protein